MNKTASTVIVAVIIMAIIIAVIAVIATALSNWVIYGYLEGDYCSGSEPFLNKHWVEYCIVDNKGIQCSEPEEQIICQQHDKNLEKLGQ